MCGCDFNCDIRKQILVLEISSISCELYQRTSLIAYPSTSILHLHIICLADWSAPKHLNIVTNQQHFRKAKITKNQWR